MTVRLRTFASIGLLIAFTLTSVSLVNAAPGPDFQISSSPSSFIVHQGASNSTSIILHSVNNFVGSLTLSAGTLPTGYSATWIPANTASLTANGTTTTTLELTVSATAQLRTSLITVTASNSTTSHFTFLFVTVVPPPQYDISISVNPATVNLRPGLQADSTITITGVNGFNSTVRLSGTVAPSGLTLGFNPVNVTVTPTTPGTSTVTIAMPLNVTYGAFSVTIYATNGTITRSGSITVNPPATNSPLFSFSLQTALYIIVAVAILAVIGVVVRQTRKHPVA